MEQRDTGGPRKSFVTMLTGFVILVSILIITIKLVAADSNTDATATVALCTGAVVVASIVAAYKMR